MLEINYCNEELQTKFKLIGKFSNFQSFLEFTEIYLFENIIIK